MSRRFFTYVLATIGCLAAVPSIGFPQQKKTSKPSKRVKAQQIYTAEKLFELHHKSVLQIQTDSGTGTGFFIGDGSTIATAAHVITGAQALEIVTADGTKLACSSLATNVQSDIAILKLTTTTAYKPLFLAKLSEAIPGQDVIVISNPLGFLTQSISKGLLSAIRVEDNLKLVQFTAEVSPGSSGGPLFNSKGQVLGLVTGSYARGQNNNFAVGSEAISEVLSAKRMSLTEFLESNTRAKKEASEKEQREKAEVERQKLEALAKESAESTAKDFAVIKTKVEQLLALDRRIRDQLDSVKSSRSYVSILNQSASKTVTEIAEKKSDLVKLQAFRETLVRAWQEYLAERHPDAEVAVNLIRYLAALAKVDDGIKILNTEIGDLELKKRNDDKTREEALEKASLAFSQARLLLDERARLAQEISALAKAAKLDLPALPPAPDID